MPNRLAREPSPYLQQHANNPVEWYPWGDEAFARARRENKPIFLSIGYSTCHWCHVMEHESFEHPGIAALLNEHFVSIKVDREERPDVDRVYMAVRAGDDRRRRLADERLADAGPEAVLRGHLLSAGVAVGEAGIPGGSCGEVSARWASHSRREILESADALNRARCAGCTRHPGRASRPAPPVRFRAVSSPAWMRSRRACSSSRRPSTRGTAGSAGRRSSLGPSELLFLLRESARSGDGNARRIAVATLAGDGGRRRRRDPHRGRIPPVLGRRAAGRVPHFEKMLYDQAQLVLAYLEAGQAAGARRALLQVAEDTLEYVRRDMTSPEGAFYSAEDADSVPPESIETGGRAKAEGAFYLWTDAEVDALLGADAEVAKRRLGIEAGGNAPQDPMGEFRGKNIPYLQQQVGEIAKLTGRTAEDVAAALGKARRTLFEARAVRPRPHLDDKVLAAWNGLMIAALARAAHVLGRRGGPSGALQAATRAAWFARERLWDAGRRVLRRRSRAGAVSIDGYAEDYAYLVWGLLELFQTSGDIEWLDWAIGAPGPAGRALLGRGGGAAGSRPRAAIPPCCCGSRKNTTARSRRPARWWRLRISLR